MLIKGWARERFVEYYSFILYFFHRVSDILNIFFVYCSYHGSLVNNYRVRWYFCVGQDKSSSADKAVVSDLSAVDNSRPDSDQHVIADFRFMDDDSVAQHGFVTDD